MDTLKKMEIRLYKEIDHSKLVHLAEKIQRFPLLTHLTFNEESFPYAKSIAKHLTSLQNLKASINTSENFGEIYVLIKPVLETSRFQGKSINDYDIHCKESYLAIWDREKKVKVFEKMFGFGDVQSIKEIIDKKNRIEVETENRGHRYDCWGTYQINLKNFEVTVIKEDWTQTFD